MKDDTVVTDIGKFIFQTVSFAVVLIVALTIIVLFSGWLL